MLEKSVITVKKLLLNGLLSVSRYYALFQTFLSVYS